VVDRSGLIGSIRFGIAGLAALVALTVAGNALAKTSSPRFDVLDRVTSGPEAAYASVRMVMCFASPYVPPPQGAPAGIAFGGKAFGVRDVFTNPSTPGTYPWNAVLVPYMPGTATLSTELSAQSTSYVRLPVALELTVKR
jgi:hypothetical protein